MTPYYPDAYLESKHCKIFAHWRTPKGVSTYAYLQALSHSILDARFCSFTLC